MALRTFAEWWADEARTLPCSQWATDEEIRADPDLYDCSRCEVRQRVEALSPENRQAWQVFNLVATRFVADLHAGDTALAWAAADVDEADRGDLLARVLGLIYDARFPVRKTEG